MSFNIDHIDINFSSTIQDIGKLSIKKIVYLLNVTVKLTRKALFHKHDLVYVSIAPRGGAFYRDALFVLILKLCRKKIVFHLHGKGISKNAQTRWKKAIYRFVFRNADVITLSKLLNYDIKAVFSGTPYVLPNGIDIKPKDITSVVDNQTPFKFIFLSNLVKNKGIGLLLEAIKELKDYHRRFMVDIVGNNGDVTIADVKAFVKRESLERIVTVLGPKHGNEKEAVLAQGDVFVFPTFYENETFGLVIIEAMAKGLAVISTPEGAIPEIIEHNINGKLIKPTTKAIKNAMQEFLEMDKEELETIKKKNIKKFMEKYSLSVFERNFVSTINNIFQTKND